MKNELECYIINNYYQLLKIAKKFTKNKDWAQELLHEVLFQLLDKDDINIPLENEEIKYYIIRALTVNWCQPTSPFYKKNKLFSMQVIDIKECLDIIDDKYNIEQDLLLDILEQEYGDLDWYNKIIFQNYLVLGTLQETSEVTNLSRSGVWNNVNETKKKLKTNTLNKLNK